MFDEISREIAKLREPRQISISMPLDDRGFFDRQCPNTECGSMFKVLFEDWTNRVSDEQVFCPFCRYVTTSDQWHTQAQAEYIQSTAQAEMARLVQGALKRGVERTRPMKWDGGLVNLSMSWGFKPGRIPDVIYAQATDVLRQEFACEQCGCRYASLGASFFCPACGHNSATSCFDNTLETVRKTIAVLETIRSTVENTVDADAAKDSVRQLLEDQFARLAGAFERFNEALFSKLPNAAQFPRKGNVFQRVDDASQLWKQALGKSYDDFLTTSELQRLKLLFQRRHVFSHCQGIIDQAYLNKSGDTGYTIGQRLIVRDNDVLEFVNLIGKLTTNLRALA